MQILARAQNFPPKLEAAQALLESLDSEIRSAAEEYRKADYGRPTAAGVIKMAGLTKRREKLAQHIGLLIDAEVIAREDTALKNIRAERKPPQAFPLPRKSKVLLAAEQEVEAAIAKVDAAHAAIRAFAMSDHRDVTKAGERSVRLQAQHKLASQEHLAASLKLTAERNAWHAACDATLEAEFKAREAKAHELLDALEDVLWPLRSRTFHMMQKLRTLRKAIK